jgi:hypothetical protein
MIALPALAMGAIGVMDRKFARATIIASMTAIMPILMALVQLTAQMATIIAQHAHS